LGVFGYPVLQVSGGKRPGPDLDDTLPGGNRAQVNEIIGNKWTDRLKFFKVILDSDPDFLDFPVAKQVDQYIGHSDFFNLEKIGGFMGCQLDNGQWVGNALFEGRAAFGIEPDCRVLKKTGQMFIRFFRRIDHDDLALETDDGQRINVLAAQPVGREKVIIHVT
jgi:hypothetical protein